MDKKLNILKDEEDLPFEKSYIDEHPDEWNEALKKLDDEAEPYEPEEPYTPSCTAHDYSPTHPWDAPGMKLSDFI